MRLYGRDFLVDESLWTGEVLNGRAFSLRDMSRAWRTSEARVSEAARTSVLERPIIPLLYGRALRCAPFRTAANRLG